ncbi:MAG: NAD(P)/FAD-dependent oxidoreductase [Gemmataceae bacterium]|nr:NAD(P)/FAD-dependent oxidoreductase [Gemmataceae bacterium]MCI0740903.1 NAD(P)/FAD-dependent oxidoreductase [Gemmataceae bacterium]
MPVLLVVGAGLFGSQAAAYARQKGIEVRVFDSGLPGAASPAAAGLFKEAWAGRKLQEHFRPAVAVLDRLYGILHVDLTHDDGTKEGFLFVPPTTILEPNPIRQVVTAVGDGWLEAGGQRHQGWVYVAAGVWSARFLPGLDVHGKAGTSFVFTGEQAGRIRNIAHGRQAIAFVRDPGCTHFSDGTAERDYKDEHERQSLERAAAMGLTAAPVRRLHGLRPYTKGGPIFQKIASRTWLATGGRKMGTILGAVFAQRLVDVEIENSD